VAYSEARRQDKAAVRDIKVRVRYAPEKLAPVEHIPQGTIKELIIWSHRSPARMRRVLAHELESPTPRIRLIRRLYEKLQEHETAARARARAQQ